MGYNPSDQSSSSIASQKWRPLLIHS
uniref:Uncharacterized protein n=1 Tax=Rhizophora mucronata TaxID=61149 RepID=A0A2P2JED8_RHIMU